MKTINTILTPLTVVLLLTTGCQKQLTDKLTDGINFNMKMDTYFKNQLAIQVYNANYMASSRVPSPKITISGPDAGLVYDINGTKEIKVDNQYALMVVSPGIDLSPAHPAAFTIKVEAEGFMPIERSFLIKDSDAFSDALFEMIEYSSTPKGIVAAKSDLIVLNQDGGLASNKTFKTAAEQGVGLNMSLTLPQGAKALDQNNNPLLGAFDVNLVQFDPEERTAFNAQPSLRGTAQTIERNGKISEEALNVLGYADLTVRSTTKQAASFDKPFQFDFSIPAGMVNKITGEKLVAGSTVDVFQKSADGILRAVGSSNLETTAGFLKASIKLFGATDIVIASAAAPKAKTCATPLTVTFSRLNIDVNTLHYVEVLNASTGTILSSKTSVPVQNGLKTVFSALPTSVTSLRVNVYPFETSPNNKTVNAIPNNATPIVTVNINGACPTATTLAVNPQKSSGNPLLQFDLDTYCSTSKTVYYHAGRSQFRLANTTGPWIDLGLATRIGTTVATATYSTIAGAGSDKVFSRLTTDRLKFGTRFDFQTSISGPIKGGTKIITKSYTRARTTKIGEYKQTTAPTGPTGNYPGGVFRYSLTAGWNAPIGACADFGY